MSESDIIDIARDALLVTVIVSGPLMLISLVVGLALSLFQALTQIQEQTLTFIPKIVLMFAATIFLLPFMLGHMKGLTDRVMDRIVSGQVFAFLLVFVRMGAAFLIMPVIGEQFVSANIRLLFALLFALLLVPVVGSSLPPQPAAAGPLALLILGEALVGIFLGTMARILISTLETTGFLIANQIGLSTAQAFNPAFATQGTPVSALMGFLALLLILSTNLHHVLILGVADSYSLFVPGQPMPLGDMTDQIARLVSHSFAVGVQIATPFLVIGFLFNFALGLLSRLVPQIQVFFVGLPLQVLLGTLLFAGSLSALMLVWLRDFEDTLIQLLRI